MTENPYRTDGDEPINPTKDRGAAPPNSRDWHETARLPCGTRVGKRGSLWYVLDEDGWAISEGYHEIDAGATRGKRGEVVEEIDLRGKPDIE